MKIILKPFLIGLLVAVGGVVFAGIFASFFNGIDVGSACATGIGTYLCIVIVVCTGVIISKNKI